MERSRLTRYAWLSIAAALLTISLKMTAYLLTGSVGLLSDALESLVNLLAAVSALGLLAFAARPPDQSHDYGHQKAEYISSVIEGLLILVAAAGIITAAWPRLWNPEPLEQLGIGLAVSLAAAAINLGTALTLLRAGRKYHSIALEADAHHLLTDVWTSGGVLLGLGAVALTGWQLLDPLLGLAMAANILSTGVRVLWRSFAGLLDPALPEAERRLITDILDNNYVNQGIVYHALRTRQAGARRFVSLHILVPGDWSVQRGHQILEQIEADIRRALPGSTVFTHLEPLEDPLSFRDTALDRSDDLEQHSQQV